MILKEKKIVLELFDRYSNKEELSQVVAQDLKEQGKQCQIVDNYTILVNNRPYTLSERIVPIMGYVLHEAVLYAVE